MNLRNLPTRILLAAIALSASATPSYAAWGSFSAYAFAAKNQSVVCTYGSSFVGVLRASRNYANIAPFGSVILDDAVFTNLAATANVFLAGYDSKSPNNGSNWPIMYIQNGVKTNQSLDFATVTNENFFDTFNLQAGCQVGN